MKPIDYDFTSPFPIDLARTLGPIKRGRRDATAFGGGTGFWRATRTPDGPATQRIWHLADDRTRIAMRAYGPGSQWLADRVERLVGLEDNNDSFPTVNPMLTNMHRQHRDVRFCCTQNVWEALMPCVLEQKVTGKEARNSYAHLLQVFGEAAPQAPGGPRLLLPPEAKTVASAPSHVFHAANVERKRSEAIRGAASYAHRLTALADMSIAEARSSIAGLSGIGEWTIAEIAVVALGDADSVSVGDYHLKNWVAWNFANKPRGTDAEMLALLEPFRPQRGRAIRYMYLGGTAPPRYGPRLTIQTRY
jgi:3-methyladenine DNA glycosylase/8-oxoguanine DNA glycosylase